VVCEGRCGHDQLIGKRGLEDVLTERGIDTKGKTVKQLQEIMARQPDFLEERSRIEQLARTHCMTILRGVKFHPELMPIEQLNGQFKRPVRQQLESVLKGSIKGLAELCSWSCTR